VAHLFPAREGCFGTLNEPRGWRFGCTDQFPPPPCGALIGTCWWSWPPWMKDSGAG